MSSPVLIPKKFQFPAIVEGNDGIRRFSDSALQAQIEKVYASLPKDKAAAVISVGADKEGIAAVAAANLGHGFSLMGGLEKRYGGDWKGEAQVMWVPGGK